MRSIPKSPKILRLDLEISEEKNPVAKACLRAERAGFLARQGHFDDARISLEILQKEFQFNPDARLSVWMQIANGWMAHYGDQPGAARDHFQRAGALSSAAGLNELRCLSFAWLAHLAYSQNNFVGMQKNIKVALHCGADNFHPAQTRLNMVVALAYHYARRLDLAKNWYARCREHALAEGDDGSLSALSFNMAALQANHAIQSSVFGGDVARFSGFATMGASSVQSFDQLVNTASRKSWVYMIKAYTCSSVKNFQEADSLYVEHMNDACAQGMEHQRAFFLADRAWCRWNLGRSACAQEDIDETIRFISDAMYVEDRAIAYGRLGQVFSAMGCDELANQYSGLAQVDWSAHERAREELLELLNDLQK